MFWCACVTHVVRLLDSGRVLFEEVRINPYAYAPITHTDPYAHRMNQYVKYAVGVSQYYAATLGH